MHQSWRSRHIISQLTAEQQAAIRVKIVGYTLLGNRTKHWGINRAWHGDYLGQHTLNNEVDLYNQSLMNLRATGAVSQVLFSTMVYKLSHRVSEWGGVFFLSRLLGIFPFRGLLAQYSNWFCPFELHCRSPA